MLYETFEILEKSYPFFLKKNKPVLNKTFDLLLDPSRNWSHNHGSDLIMKTDLPPHELWCFLTYPAVHFKVSIIKWKLYTPYQYRAGTKCTSNPNENWSVSHSSHSSNISSSCNLHYDLMGNSLWPIYQGIIIQSEFTDSYTQYAVCLWEMEYFLPYQ